MMLNAHPQLYAGQELYLLAYHTMGEREQRLGAANQPWVFEGLRKTVLELAGVGLDEAEELIERMSGLSTRDVYAQLAAWAGPGVFLVDKTPTYVWSLEALRRAEAVFADPVYIFVHRHPHAAVASMAELALPRGLVADAHGGETPAGDAAVLDAALWAENEALWATGNANALAFLAEIPPHRSLRLAYEDLLTDPAAAAAAMCGLVGVPFHAGMVTPYTPANIATFEPASAGGLGAGDPKLLSNKRIDALMATAWLAAKPPSPASPFASSIALALGYPLPAWKEPALRAAAPGGLARLNATTGGGMPVVVLHTEGGRTSRLRHLGASLEGTHPVFALKMGAEARAAAAEGGLRGLAGAHAQTLAHLSLPPVIGVVAFGPACARAGHALAAKLAADGGGGRCATLFCVGGDPWAPTAGCHDSVTKLVATAREAAAAWGAPGAPDGARLRSALAAAASPHPMLEQLESLVRPLCGATLSDWDLFVDEELRCGDALRSAADAYDAADDDGEAGDSAALLARCVPVRLPGFDDPLAQEAAAPLAAALKAAGLAKRKKRRPQAATAGPSRAQALLEHASSRA